MEMVLNIKISLSRKGTFFHKIFKVQMFKIPIIHNLHIKLKFFLNQLNFFEFQKTQYFFL